MIIGCVSLINLDGLYVALHDKKRGYILPGGKWEPGETFEEAAARELWEEVGLTAIKQKLFFHAMSTDGAYCYVFSTTADLTVVNAVREYDFVLVSRDKLFDSVFGPFYRLML